MTILDILKSFVFTDSDIVIEKARVHIFIAFHVDSAGNDKHREVRDDVTTAHFYTLEGFF